MKVSPKAALNGRTWLQVQYQNIKDDLKKIYFCLAVKFVEKTEFSVLATWTY